MRWVELINREEADVVVIAGDMIDTDIRPLYAGDMAAALRKIQSRHGVFLSPGNHEYITGIDQSLEFARSAGITVLRDSMAVVDGRVILAGRDDLTNPRRKSLAALLEGVTGDLPVVVVDHQPSRLEESAAAGVALQISGHTHRGQVWPITWITDRIFEDSHGLIYKDGTAVFVSSGLGIWGGKFRIGSVSDYVVINI